MKYQEACFSATYDEARQKFRRLARARGFTLESLPINIDWDDDLTIDVAYYQAPQANQKHNVFLHISGTHGVEGFSGSAIQLDFLRNFKKIRPTLESTNTTLILVHILNPYGMKYSRRFNEHNVDLNRNFILDRKERLNLMQNPSPLFMKLNPWLNPNTPQRNCEQSIGDKFQLGKLAILEEHSELKQVTAGGQYANPKGMFFGGFFNQPSHVKLGLFLIGDNKKHINFTKNTNRVVILDVHTGLGPAAIDTLLVNTQDDKDRLDAITNHYPYTQVRDPKKSVSYKIHGNVILGYQKVFEGADLRRVFELEQSGGDTETQLPVQVMGVVQEFGTMKEINTVMRIRKENSQYNYMVDEFRRSIKSVPKKDRVLKTFEFGQALLNRPCGVKDVFYFEDDLEWKKSVISRGWKLFYQCLSKFFEKK